MSKYPDGIFRSDEGDFNVSLFTSEGKLKFRLAQKALRELGDLSDRVMIQREALQALRTDIMDLECNLDTKIIAERARDDDGKFIADDPDTPDVNEAYVKIE